MSACCHQTQNLEGTAEPGGRRHVAAQWFSFGLLAMLAGVAMTMTLALNLDPPSGPIRTATHAILATITFICIAVFGRQVVRRAAGLRITMESLFLNGLFGAFAGSL